MEWWLYHDAMMVGREQRWLHLVWVCGKKMSGCVGIALCYSKQNHSWPSIPYHIIPTTRHHKIQHNSIWYQVGVWACCHIDTHLAKRLLQRKCIFSCVWSNHNYKNICPHQLHLNHPDTWVCERLCHLPTYNLGVAYTPLPVRLTQFSI